jgi:serine/threonine protein kinase
MSVVPGTRLGAYEVVALIGAGGMGEVYCALDTRLRRDVATVSKTTSRYRYDRISSNRIRLSRNFSDSLRCWLTSGCTRRLRVARAPLPGAGEPDR